MAKMKHHIEQFSGIKDFLSTIRERPQTPTMSNADSSQHRESDGRGWYGTRNYEEAEKLLLYGWDKPAEDIKAKMRLIDKLDTTQAMNKTQVRYNVVGASPCVPRALLGIPESMYEYFRNPQKVRTVSILYGISASCGESIEALTKNGVAIMQIIYRLEKLGFKVSVDIFESAYEGENHWGWRMPVKDFKQPLDILKMCFPIAHPSMLRRFSFRWLETAPLLPKGFNYGYGTPIHHSSTARKEFEETYLRQNEHIIYSNDCSKSKWEIEKIMQRAGLDKTVDRSTIHVDTLDD
jgi:hypothetical protein